MAIFNPWTLPKLPFEPMDHILQLYIGGKPSLPERSFVGTTVFHIAVRVPANETTVTLRLRRRTLLLTLNGQRASQWLFVDAQTPVNIPPFAFFATVAAPGNIEVNLAEGSSTLHCMGFTQQAIPLLAEEFDRYADLAAASTDAETAAHHLPPRFLPYTIHKYLDRLHDTDKKGFALNLYRKEALYQIAKLYHTSLMAATPKPRATHDEELMRQAEAYIQRNGTNPTFNVDSLARVVGLSRRNLYRLFENQGKPTPQKMILQTRLEKAHELLRNTDYSVGDVATMTGFNHLSYFAKQYKTRFGHLPKENT